MVWIVIGGVVLLVALILLEGWRQAKYYGPPSGGGVSGIGSAMLELQGMLEPEKKVEVLLCEEDETEASESGEPDSPEEE